jgi:hypothetical protein
MNNRTSSEFDHVVAFCRNLYAAKLSDYGTSWRILRPSSLTDQIYIKARRIRSLQENKLQMIEEGIQPEFVGIFNYAIMSLIQLSLDDSTPMELPTNKALELYDFNVGKTKSLMMAKNHDYDEAWRNMRISSLTDIILMKLMRLKQIEDNDGVTNVSEGLAANYADIANYAAFALIKISETDKNTSS